VRVAIAVALAYGRAGASAPAGTSTDADTAIAGRVCDSVLSWCSAETVTPATPARVLPPAARSRHATGTPTSTCVRGSTPHASDGSTPHSYAAPRPRSSRTGAAWNSNACRSTGTASSTCSGRPWSVL
jgi:hypothetical protein